MDDATLSCQLDFMTSPASNKGDEKQRNHAALIEHLTYIDAH
ncbi:hypothetical protein [Mesorhizobium sp. WSM3868]|nr:hypothetical protein [Mesorhizobium sp. WSM3868]